ncbi:MAG: hypothetical protein AAFX41_11030, partial [Bacteroidota bacterium]
MTRTVYVLQPESRPPPSMGDEPVIHRFERRITSVTELQAALTLHRSPDDVPLGRDADLRRLRRLLESGTVLVQHSLVTTAHPDVAPRTAKGDGVGLPIFTAARILGRHHDVLYRAIRV